MPKTRRILTNYSKGELSPLLEGMPDLAAYFEGGAFMENFLVLRQGGMTRWHGTRFIEQVRNPTEDTIIIPFEFSVNESYILEFGNFYFCIYKNKARIEDALGFPIEVVTPYSTADLRELHYTQSADVLFLFHPNHQQRKVSRVSDTEWSIPVQTASPPPSYAADTSLFCFMALGANTGTGIEFRLSSGNLLDADANRQIIRGAGKAILTTFTDVWSGVADIIDDFNQTITTGPNTLTSVGTTVTSTAHAAAAGDFIVLTSGAQAGELRQINTITDPDTVELVAAFSIDQAGPVTWNKILPTPAEEWGLRLSPQTTLDPNVARPVGAVVTLTAGVNAFRNEDQFKFVNIYGGVVQITNVASSTVAAGTIMSEMGDIPDTTVDPSAAVAGTWTLEVKSWDTTRGFPRTGEFFQGRLWQAATAAQPTTLWGSRSDDYDNYAVGITAEDAVEYTMASRQLNRIEWLADKSRMLYIGTSGAEHAASGSGNDNQLIGGDTVPMIERIATNGCMGIQPVMARQTLLYIDRSKRRVMALGFDIAAQSDADRELSVGSEHITGSGVRQGHMAYAKRLNPRLYFIREDGTLVSMTFFPEQKICAFTRRITQGTFESVAVIPSPNGGEDQVWVVVKRLIGSTEKRYVEMFEDNHELLTGRLTTAIQTDASTVITGQTGTLLPGLSHLLGMFVDVVKNGNFIGDFPVVDFGFGNGGVVLPDPFVAEDVFEVGLHYTSTFESMPPAIEGQVIEGMPRDWESLFVRVYNTRGGTLNGQPLTQQPQDVGVFLVTGDQAVKPGEIVRRGARVRITQDEPYPMTILCHFGTLKIGDTDDVSP